MSSTAAPAHTGWAWRLMATILVGMAVGYAVSTPLPPPACRGFSGLQT